MNILSIIKVMIFFVSIFSDIVIFILENLNNGSLIADIIEINKLHTDILIMRKVINRTIAKTHDIKQLSIVLTIHLFISKSRI
jgi:hypothetical protein